MLCFKKSFYLPLTVASHMSTLIKFLLATNIAQYHAVLNAKMSRSTRRASLNENQEGLYSVQQVTTY